MFQEIYDASLKANYEIINYLGDLRKSDFEYGEVGFGGDFSSGADLECEKIFIKYLLPFADIFSEESGFVESNSTHKLKNAKFIIDPLDGSDNFLSNLPYFGSSVALEVNGQIKFSMIFNYASKKFVSRIEDRLICDLTHTNEKIAIFERAYAHPQMCQKLFDNNVKFRSPGAVALGLANARFYKFVLFCGNLREFDLAAGLHINQDLHIYQDNENLLVSKSKDTFDFIKKLIRNK